VNKQVRALEEAKGRGCVVTGLSGSANPQLQNLVEKGPAAEASTRI